MPSGAVTAAQTMAALVLICFRLRPATTSPLEEMKVPLGLPLLRSSKVETLKVAVGTAPAGAPKESKSAAAAAGRRAGEDFTG